MRSRLSIKGHPLHTMLVPFPLAFFIGGMVFDVLGWYRSEAVLWMTGGYLVVAGIVTALLAATAGLVDYAYTVPPASTAKQRATAHMVFNLLAVLMFSYSAAWRGNPQNQPTRAIIAIQIAATIALIAGSWMGGTLVARNQIGVDHRYAGAGRWREGYFDPRPDEPVTVATAGELGIGQMKLLHLNGTRIVLARTDRGYCAFEDHCSHHGGSLCDGALINGVVQCAWHGSQFDIATGRVMAGPAEAGIRVFPVTESGRTVQVTLDAAPREAGATSSPMPA